MGQVHPATAIVEVVVEVDVGPYGGEWTLQDIFDQALREAPAKVTQYVQKHGGMRVVSTPNVKVIIPAKGD